MTDTPKKTNPTAPPLPQNIIDGAGIPCAPPPTPVMPPLRDADASKLRPVPLDWQGNPKDAA